jgi:hypothetical protein
MLYKPFLQKEFGAVRPNQSSWQKKFTNARAEK